MAGSWWDEFSNNLATDLAPLISLFGEAPTKQYLSECLTKTDIIIFSMAPLGIITTIVSAIRVCGTPSLRAFIGRAQEGAGNAEAELCSSTSREVCELYNNGGIARVFGRPKLLEIVHDQNATREDFFRTTPDSQATAGIYLFKDYIKKDNQDWQEITRRVSDEEKEAMKDESDNDQDFAIHPNLSLNVGIKQGSKHWFTAAAIFGGLLQSSVLVWATIARYKFNDMRRDIQDTYAIPLAVIGTCLLCLGTGLCAALIEGSTKERIFERRPKSDGDGDTATSQIYWVQPGTQFVGDQAFDSFAYTHKKGEFTRYITSWKIGRNGNNGAWIWCAITSTSLGFLLQFLGLRACHSSVAVAQLGATILMSVVRSTLRASRLREEDVSLAHKPDLYKTHELDWFALNIGTELGPSHLDSEFKQKWTVISGPYHTAKIFEKRWRLPKYNPSVQGQFLKNENLAFVRMLVDHAGSCILSGFRIDVDDPTISGNEGDKPQSPEDWWDPHFKMDETWKFHTKCAPYRWHAAVQSKQSASKSLPVEACVSSFIYRARLARLTDSWEDKLVSVRSTVRILAKTIESTIQVFLTSDTDFEKGWDSAFTIFWAVHSTLEGADPTSGDIYLSLSREIDKDGQPTGKWHVDESELEAVLGLWLWSLRDMRNKPQIPLRRIISPIPDSTIDKYTTTDFYLWRENGGFKIDERKIKVNGQTGLVFGRHNIPVRDWTNLTVLEVATDTTSLQMMCAQEIYALFFSSITHSIKNLSGKTEFKKSSGLKYVNENVTKLLRAFTDSGLGSAVDAFTCVIPALIIQRKLLPVFEPYLVGRDEADTFVREKNWRDAETLLLRPLLDAEKLLSWAVPYSQQSQLGSNPEEGPVQGTEFLNHYSLLVLSLCECYRKALYYEEVEFSLGGITKILYQSSLGQQKQISLFGTNCSYTGKNSANNHDKVWFKRRSRYTLADAVHCYAKAFIRIARFQTCYNPEPFEETIMNLQKALIDRNAISKPDYLLENLLDNERIRGEYLGDTLLQEARNGNLEYTLFLLNEESSLNEGSSGGETLAMAAKQGWYPVVKSLIEYGACFEWKDKMCRDAVSYAAENGDINSLNYLLAKGALPDITDSSRRRPLFYAASYGHIDIIKRLLLDKRVDPNAKGNSGKTPLSVAAEHGHEMAVDLLLSTPAVDAAHQDDFQRTPLSLAAENGHFNIVRLLLAQEAESANLVDSSLKTPISYAAENGHEDIVNLLISSKWRNPRLNGD
ncbi:ankyrin repeat-containing protein [Trichophyton equinum CBS 127.97]|uniref:Ankyrin repeat-containing protein n=1 Tax=Trichophyton equinum (strain ATCC MYA-4606 / CBS 127.97) TaxID=559882 RepID=F2PMV9_TRIEC|nr:ankyrin repeat-containing protein [Trichophyton equinum CBS 127.97]